VSNTISSLLQAAGTYSPRKASIYIEKFTKNISNSGKITISFVFGTRTPETLISPRNILGQNIFQGHSTDKVYFYPNSRARHEKYIWTSFYRQS